MYLHITSSVIIYLMGWFPVGRPHKAQGGGDESRRQHRRFQSSKFRREYSPASCPSGTLGQGGVRQGSGRSC